MIPTKPYKFIVAAVGGLLSVVLASSDSPTYYPRTSPRSSPSPRRYSPRPACG
jgi:hypothetical protein